MLSSLNEAHDFSALNSDRSADGAASSRQSQADARGPSPLTHHQHSNHASQFTPTPARLHSPDMTAANDPGHPNSFAPTAHQSVAMPLLATPRQNAADPNATAAVTVASLLDHPSSGDALHSSRKGAVRVRNAVWTARSSLVATLDQLCGSGIRQEAVYDSIFIRSHHQQQPNEFGSSNYCIAYRF
jgi:hypothetical protein